MEADEIIERLEEAGHTLLSAAIESLRERPVALMPGVSLVKFRPARGVVPEPSVNEPCRMQEAYAWLTTLDGRARYAMRWTMFARSLVHPVTGEYCISWRSIGRAISCEHRVVQRIHRKGAELIAARLG